MITGLEIRNFKCFEKLTVNFNKLTVLAGGNSSGKSSTIQSLLLIKIALEKWIQHDLSNQAREFPENILVPLNGKYALNLGNTLEVLTRNSNADTILLSCYGEAEEMANFLFSVHTDSDDIYNLILSKGSSISKDYSEFRGEFHYLCAERIGPRLSYDVAQQDFSHVGYHGEYAVQVLAQKKQEQIVEASNRKFMDSEDTKVLSQVRLWMEYLIPNFYIDEAQLEGKLQKAFTTYSSSIPTNVGFGISYVLPIVVTCMIASNDSVIVIENPEAHLHPKGQSNIGFFIGKMISSGLQIIIETHSEHVINGIRRAVMPNENKNTNNVLINFFSNDNSVTEIKLLETGDLNLFPRDFFDQVQQDMAELFQIQKSNNG